MAIDRKSTRLNSSHLVISYAVFCLKKKKKTQQFSRSYSAPFLSSLNIFWRTALCTPSAVAVAGGSRQLRTAFVFLFFFFFNDTATTEIYTLSLHDALPIYRARPVVREGAGRPARHQPRG